MVWCLFKLSKLIWNLFFFWLEFKNFSMFIFVQKFHIFFPREKNQNETKAAKHKEMLVCLFCCIQRWPQLCAVFLYASIVAVCKLLTPFNEAVLKVNPWVGKCYSVHFTDRELKHMGNKWFVEVLTLCIAEQGLEVTFQITGLELLPEVPAQPFLCPLPTASAPASAPSGSEAS